MKPAKGKNEYRLAPGCGWGSSSPELLALVWMRISKADDDAKWTGVLDAAGDLQNLLLPIVALKYYEPVDVLQGKRADVLRAIAIFRTFPGHFVGTPDGGRREVSPLDGSEFERFAAHLQQVASRLEDAGKKLRREGWKFNPATKKVSRIAGHKGRDLLAECVRAVYMAEHRGEYDGASTTKKLSIRRKIAVVLAPYFDAMELAPESGAPIYMAIYKGGNPPK